MAIKLEERKILPGEPTTPVISRNFYDTNAVDSHDLFAIDNLLVLISNTAKILRRRKWTSLWRAGSSCTSTNPTHFSHGPVVRDVHVNAGSQNSDCFTSYRPRTALRSRLEAYLE